MYTFKKILVPVDGSEFSRNAARLAISIAEKYQSQLTLIHVIAQSLNKISIRKGKPDNSIEEFGKLKKQGIEVLESVVAELGNHDVNIEILLSWGNPVDAVLEEIDKNDYDLLVMGSRGLGTIRGLLLGSVNEGISQKVNCPVLTVKALS